MIIGEELLNSALSRCPARVPFGFFVDADNGLGGHKTGSSEESSQGPTIAEARL